MNCGSQLSEHEMACISCYATIDNKENCEDRCGLLYHDVLVQIDVPTGSQLKFRHKTQLKMLIVLGPKEPPPIPNLLLIFGLIDLATCLRVSILHWFISSDIEWMLSVILHAFSLLLALHDHLTLGCLRYLALAKGGDKEGRSFL